MQFLLQDADPGLLIDYATDTVLMGESLQQVLGQSVPGMGTMFVMMTVFQASGSSLLLTLTRAPLGSARWPMDISPKFMQIIGHVSPVAWAMDGFTALTYEGAHLVDAWVPLAVRNIKLARLAGKDAGVPCLPSGHRLATRRTTREHEGTFSRIIGRQRCAGSDPQALCDDRFDRAGLQRHSL